MDFYKKFFRGVVCLEQIPEVFRSWLASHAPDDLPCLEFILDEPPPLSPFEKVTVIGVDAPQELLKLRFRIVFGKWNEEEWTEVVPIAHLPQVVGEFLGVVDAQDKCIYVQQSPWPCPLGPIDPTECESAHAEDKLVQNPYPKVKTKPQSYTPAVEIPINEE